MNRSGDVADQGAAAQASSEEVGDRRRSRMSARLSGVFGGGRRREREQVAEGSSWGGAGTKSVSGDAAE